MSEAGLSLRVMGAGKTFARAADGLPALEHVDLDVGPGEFLCLLGPSGCGKSTLLRMIAGFLEPDAGAILAGGAPARGPHPDRCMIFQSPTLFPWLTTRDNVLFGPRAQRRATKEARRRAADLLDAVGLGQFAGHYPAQLSGGMRHRAALARALVNRPRVLLMDEPFAALDAITRASMQELLLDLWAGQGMTVLFVTHDVAEAILLGDRVCVMSPRPGRIVESIPIDVARPRGVATAETLEFVELRRRIRTVLEAAMGGGSRGPARPAGAAAGGTG